MSNARRTIAVVLVNLLLFPLTPQTAHAQAAMAASTESYAAPDVTSSTLSAATATTATAAAKAPEIPVSAQGNYQTAIPIVVPPGRAGIQPSMALRYDSGSSKRASSVGAGWSFDVSAVSRSLIEGFPSLRRASPTSTTLLYEEDPRRGAAFTIDGLDLALVNTSEAPDPMLASSIFLAGKRATDATVMEYSAVDNGWVAHLPNGSKRAYGYDPVSGETAHLKNELGTSRWLLLREWDVSGNRIVYEYHNLSNSELLSAATADPFVRKVSWGGNDKTTTADFFSIETTLSATTGSGETDMLNGALRLAPYLVSSIAVCAPVQTMQRVSGAISVGIIRTAAPCLGTSLVRQLELTYLPSLDTGRQLLSGVVETAVGVVDPVRYDFDYSTNGGKVAFANLAPLFMSSDPDMGLLLTREARGPGTPPLGAATRELAVDPPMTSIGARLIDINSDGRTDIIYHPTGIRSPNASIVSSVVPLDALPATGFASYQIYEPYLGPVARSGLRNANGSYSLLTPPQETGLSGETSSDLADIDGDGLIDEVQYTLGKVLDQLPLNRNRQQCFNDNFWRQCGVIDPYDLDGLEMCANNNQCEEYRLFDYNFCSEGLCWVDEALFVEVFADVEDWQSTPPSSPAGSALLAQNGFAITSQLDRIAVDGGELRARLGIEGEDSNLDVDDSAMWKSFFGSSFANLAEVCEELIENCRSADDDGIPKVSFETDFEISVVLECHPIPITEWGDPVMRCEFVRSTNAGLRSAKMMVGVHLNGDESVINPPRVPLYGWPDDVGKRSVVNTPVVINGDGQPPWNATIEHDFSAPVVDINADGRADIVLTRATWATLTETYFRFTPRAYLTGPPINPNASRVGFRSDWKLFADKFSDPEAEEKAVVVSEFTQSMNDILVGPFTFVDCLFGDCPNQQQNKYLLGAAYNSFLMDVNADGLPDLIVGKADAVSASGDIWRRADFNTNPGHNVHLNRGYRFGFGTTPHAGLSGGPWADILKGDLTKRPLDASLPTPNGRAPVAATAFTDLNADGRSDVVVWHRDMVSQAITLKLWLNQNDAYVARTGSSAYDYLDAGATPALAGARFKSLGLRLADVQPNRPTGAASSERFRAISGADFVRFEDVDDDGLVDILIPGVICSKLPIANQPDCVEIQVATPDQWSTLSRSGQDLQYVPARVMRNQNVHPDMLVYSERDDGVRSAISYADARNHPELVPADVYVPSGKIVVASVTTALTMDGDETVSDLSYGKWLRGASTSVSLGFQSVEVRRLRSFLGVAEDEPLIGRRTFSAASTDDFAHRGLVVLEETIGGGEIHKTRSSYVTRSPWAGSRARRIDRDVTTTTSCSSADGVACSGPAFSATTRVTSRSLYGAVLTEESGDGDGASSLNEVLKTNRDVDERTGPWMLGLVVHEEVRGRAFALDGSSIASAEMSTTDFDYDAVGRLVYRKTFDVIPQTCDAVNGHYSSVFTVDGYDSYGNATKTTSNGRVATITYDAQKLYPAKTSISVERYLDGTVVGNTSLNSSRWTDIRTGAVWSISDPNGAVTETTRDALGRPVKVYDALGVEVAAYTYGNDGLPGVVGDDNMLPTTTETTYTSTTSPRTAKQTITMTDGAGNVARRYVFDLTGSTLTNGERVEFHERDSDGRDVLAYLPASTTSDPLPSAAHVTLTYDALGRVLTATAADTSRVTEYRYAPRFQEVTDPVGVTTTTITDRNANPTAVTRKGGSLIATTQWQRDGIGQLVGLTDADGNVQRFEYDRGGNLSKWTLPHRPTVAASGTFTKCYNADGQVLRSVDADGRETKAKYDKLGRAVAVVVKGSYSGSQSYTMSYDATGAGARLGRMWRSTDAVGATDASFDVNGRPTSTLRSFNTVAGINRIKTTPTWGLQGELKTLNITGGVGTTVTTALGTIGVSYSPRGRLTTVTDAGTQLLGNVVYDAFGQPSSFGIGVIPTPTTERVTAAFTRNPLTREVTSIRYTRPSLSLVDIKLGAYGKDGSPGTEVRTSAVDATGGTATVSKTWGYDSLRRLSAAKIVRNGTTLQNVGYSYSPGGRLLSVAGSTPQTYSYGRPDLPGAVTQLGGRQLTYDQSGSLKTDTQTNSQAQFAANGCLERMASLTGASLTQLCDVAGNAMYRETNSSGPILQLGMSELRGKDGAIVHRLPLNGLVTMELVYKTSGSRMADSRIVMADTRGSVVAVAPLLGTAPASPSASQDFDAWGAPISVGTSGAPKHGFVDHEADSAFGTYAFGRRVYDPTLRRWLSADPLISVNPTVNVVGDQLDLWSYAASNPVARTDVTGTFAPLLLVAAIGMLGGITVGFESDQQADLLKPGAGALALAGPWVAAEALAVGAPALITTTGTVMVDVAAAGKATTLVVAGTVGGLIGLGGVDLKMSEDDHYSAKGGHKERTLKNEADRKKGHKEHWKKDERKKAGEAAKEKKAAREESKKAQSKDKKEEAAKDVQAPDTGEIE